MTPTELKALKRRRRAVMDMMGSGVAVLPTAPESTRNNDVTYPFRADSDFYYLTRFPEPEAVAVLIPGRELGEFVLFCRDRDQERETWTGLRAGLKGATERYGADDAFPIEDIGDILPGLLENHSKVFYNMGRYPQFDAKLINWVGEVKRKSRIGINAPGELVDLSHIVHELRLVKSAEEIKLMKRAGRISAAAHTRAMRYCRPGLMEYQLQAELEHEFLHGGCRSTAYPSIVAGGANACILHYTENDSELKSGDLVLVDAGGELDGYASDITRTYPVNGRFSAEQRVLYEIVLAAELAALEACQPDGHWNDPHDAALAILVDGLLELGILAGSRDECMETENYRRFYMHRTGHWLGLDVHDVGDYKVDSLWRVLEPGMTFTVEPGLYIPVADDIDPRWRGIGIRVEDNVLITRQGHEILTAAVPKAVDDIEHLMAQDLKRAG